MKGMVIEAVVLIVVSVICIISIILVAFAAYFGYSIFTFAPRPPSGSEYYSPSGIVSGNVPQAPLPASIATREDQTIKAILAANTTTTPINNPID